MSATAGTTSLSSSNAPAVRSSRSTAPSSIKAGTISAAASTAPADRVDDYGAGVSIRGDNPYDGGNSRIFAEGAFFNNITDFHRFVTEGHHDNPTIEPSVRSNLTTILGRTGGLSQYRRHLGPNDERHVKVDGRLDRPEGVTPAGARLRKTLIRGEAIDVPEDSWVSSESCWSDSASRPVRLHRLQTDHAQVFDRLNL